MPVPKKGAKASFLAPTNKSKARLFYSESFAKIALGQWIHRNLTALNLPPDQKEALTAEMRSEFIIKPCRITFAQDASE